MFMAEQKEFAERLVPVVWEVRTLTVLTSPIRLW